MNERSYMTKEGFRSLKKRDWDNGAVRDELYESVCRMERMQAQIKAAPNCPQQEIMLLQERIAELVLDRGRKDTQIAVFLSAIAAEARNGRAEWAQNIVRTADTKAKAVKPSDLVVAHVSTGTKANHEP